MHKWYEENGVSDDVVISSRIRLARNIERYHFAKKLEDDSAVTMVEEVGKAFENYSDSMGQYYTVNPGKMSEIERLAMVERHIMSPALASKKQATGLVMSENESATIMVNEEDHVRIQVLAGGMNIDKAFKLANELDDFCADKLGFAFDEKYGYLTSCPTNVGTGLRASYMVFLPALGGANKINRLSDEVAKYGITLRGIYGEGTNGLGNIYQISNQKTMGSTEQEIIYNLNSIVGQVIKQERKRREFLLSNNYDEIEDQVYRSYGVLKYTRQINSKDAMTLLAQIKFGVDTGIIHFEKEFHIYQMMMAIQPYSLQCHNGKYVGSNVRDRLRAEYLNANLPQITK